ncbi:MAG: hypothetical protein IJH39_12125 [Clostridia bacterium]|nr:hypothetical protein [Clostridia bacterium]
MMEKIKKLFGGIDLSWKKLIIFSIIAGAYTAIMAMLPIAKDTSFADITISFEVWILFGIFIIMNSKSAKESSLKCFVFFLISQPLVYLIQDVINHSNLFLTYYRFWIIWTICTIPMGFIGYFMKKDKWWGLLILIPMLIFLGFHYSGFLGQTIYNFPYHFLSALFCIITILLYPICIFSNKKVKVAGITISALIILIMSIITLFNSTTYNTVVLTNNGETGAVFDNTYTVYLEDSSYGDVSIKYDDGLEDYLIEAKFKKAGRTNLILEDSNGNKEIYEIDIKNNDFDINKKEKEINKELSQWKTKNVKITVKEDSITKTSADIIIEDKNENPVSWGMNFVIQRAGDNNIWVDMITKEIVTWAEIAMKPNENGITEMQLDWSKIYGELSSGTYRIVKYSGLSTIFSEPFEVK